MEAVRPVTSSREGRGSCCQPRQCTTGGQPITQSHHLPSQSCTSPLSKKTTSPPPMSRLALIRSVWSMLRNTFATPKLNKIVKQPSSCFQRRKSHWRCRQTQVRVVMDPNCVRERRIVRLKWQLSTQNYLSTSPASKTPSPIASHPSSHSFPPTKLKCNIYLPVLI